MNSRRILLVSVFFVSIFIAARVFFSLISSIDSQLQDGLSQSGQKSEEKGNFKDAIEKYQQLSKIDRSFLPKVLLGRVYHKIGNDLSALEQYQLALAKNMRGPQNNFWVHYLIGELYKDSSRYDEAIAKFKELIDFPDTEKNSNESFGYAEYQKMAYRELGFCYAKTGEKQKAVEAYEKYLFLTPSPKDLNEIRRDVQTLKDAQQIP